MQVRLVESSANGIGLFKKRNLNTGCDTGMGLAYEEGGLCSLFMRHPVSGVVPPQLASLSCELQPPPRRNGETSHSRHVSCGPPRSTTPTSSLSSQLSDPLNTGCEREGTWLRERPTPAGAKRVRPSRCSRYGSGASSDHGHELALVLRPSASATGDNRQLPGPRT